MPMKHVLCYGDSNTWGYCPPTGQRYDENTRWTGRLQRLLGDGWRVHEAGMNARTSCFDDPYKPFLNGSRMLPGVLVSEKPLDAVVLSLGTNDLKTVEAWHSAQGVAHLIDIIRAHDALYPSACPVFRNGPKILVISPIQVGEALARAPGYSTLAHAHEASTRFPVEFAAMCAQKGVPMIDASRYAQPSAKDCVHMEPEGHAALAQAVAAALQELLSE